METPHYIVRETSSWGSFGIDGNESLTTRLIKDISDSHLMNIITFIKSNFGSYSQKIYKDMLNEVEYRAENQISVPDYNKTKKIKLFKTTK